VESPGSSPEYHILKDGKTLGPLTLGDLEAGLADGRYKPEDLFRTGDEQMWGPLSEIIEVVATKEVEPAALSWKYISSLAWLQLRVNLQEQPVQTGTISLAAGALTFALTRWPAVFLAPWLGVAVAAGVVLIRRRREMAGTILLLGVIAVPFLFAAVDTKMKSREAAAAEAAQKSVADYSQVVAAGPVPPAPPSASPEVEVTAADAAAQLAGSRESDASVPAANAPTSVATPSSAPGVKTAPPAAGSRRRGAKSQ